MSKFTREQLVSWAQECEAALSVAMASNPFPGLDSDLKKSEALIKIALVALTTQAVPAEVTSESKPNSSYEWRKGWNACRASMIQDPDGESQLHFQDEEDPVSARRRRNRESNARARSRESPEQRQERNEKNKVRMSLSRKGGAK